MSSVWWQSYPSLTLPKDNICPSRLRPHPQPLIHSALHKGNPVRNAIGPFNAHDPQLAQALRSPLLPRHLPTIPPDDDEI